MNTQKDIYLTDIALNRILRIDSTGKLIREVGGFGWDIRQFDRPTDIWAENALDVFVADYNNHRIQRFDRNLNFVSTFVNETTIESRLQFGYPASVAFSRFGEMFIVGQERSRVLKIDAQGTPAHSFGDYDWGAGSLEEPVQIAISEKDVIYVADAMRKAIVKFDYYGNYLQEIRHEKLTGFNALAVGAGIVVMADERQRRVFVLRIEGELLTDFALSEKFISTIAVTQNLDAAIIDNELYILDSAAAMIHCFHIQNRSR